MFIFTGLPRSGKTYRAMKYILDNFVNSKSKDYKKYRNLYTNIGGFKFDAINEKLKDNPIVIKNNDDEVMHTKKSSKLDWEDFYKHIEILYYMAKEKDDDDRLLDYLKSNELNDSLIIIDECYRYFEKRSDPVLVWLLAYHGHLAMNIILILQNKSLMHTDYKSFTETFIDAQPKNKSLFNNVFRYFHYASEFYSKDQRYEVSSLKADKKVFELYKSGDLHNPKKIIYKYIFYLVVLFFIVIYSFYSFMDRFNSKYDSDAVDAEQSQQLSTAELDYIPKIDDETFVFKIRCDDKYCNLVDEKYKDFQISISYLKYIVLEHELILSYFEVKNQVYKLISQKKGFQKITLASLTDYYYECPKFLKETYLKDLFRLKIEKKGFLNSFNNDKSQQLE